MGQKKSSADDAEAGFREWLFQPARLLRFALLAGAAVLAPWLYRQLPPLSSRDEYRLTLDKIVIDPAPVAPIPAELFEQVKKRAELPEKLSALDGQLPQRLAEAFALHPWIARVIEVRNEFPAAVKVTVEYRKPVALVQVPHGYYAVDGDGILLPPQDFTKADASEYIVIKGITSTPQNGAGHRWDDPALTAAAKLADLLAPKWKQFQIASIITPRDVPVSSDMETLQFDLLTTNGTRILWGRAPGTQHPGELTPTQKLGRLNKYLAEFGSFDRPSGPYEIDIRRWQEITRRPLVSNPTSAAKMKETATKRR
jgi:hypothetical protein